MYSSSTVFACMVVCAFVSVSFTQTANATVTDAPNTTSTANPTVTDKPTNMTTTPNPRDALQGSANNNNTTTIATTPKGSNTSSTTVPTTGPATNATIQGNSGESLHLPSLITVMLTVCALLYGFTGEM